MPGRRTHIVVGTSVGTTVAAYCAREQLPGNRYLEIAGGAAGAFFGSTFADYLEPATSSWHRSAAHSFAAGAAVLSFGAKLSLACREKAEQCRAIPMQPLLYPLGVVYVAAPVHPIRGLLNVFAELVWRFFAGLVTGFASSYASHLVLDAATPRSIPLLPGL
jgi:LexA-binding, inner membrane-associated putative hydrolase